MKGRNTGKEVSDGKELSASISISSSSERTAIVELVYLHVVYLDAVEERERTLYGLKKAIGTILVGLTP